MRFPIRFRLSNVLVAAMFFALWCVTAFRGMIWADWARPWDKAAFSLYVASDDDYVAAGGRRDARGAVLVWPGVRRVEHGVVRVVVLGGAVWVSGRTLSRKRRW